MNTSSRQPRAAKAIAAKCALTVSILAAAVAGVFASLPAAAVGRMGNLDILTRGDGQVLPVYAGRWPELGRRHAGPGVFDPLLQRDAPAACWR